jgi:hypothetical protein
VARRQTALEQRGRGGPSKWRLRLGKPARAHQLPVGSERTKRRVSAPMHRMLKKRRDTNKNKNKGSIPYTAHVCERVHF